MPLSVPSPPQNTDSVFREFAKANARSIGARVICHRTLARAHTRQPCSMLREHGPSNGLFNLPCLLLGALRIRRFLFLSLRKPGRNASRFDLSSWKVRKHGAGGTTICL